LSACFIVLQVQQQLAAAQGEASQVPGLQQRSQLLQRQLSEATSAAYAAEAQASKARQQAAQLQQQASQAQQVGGSCTYGTQHKYLQQLPLNDAMHGSAVARQGGGLQIL
jgi:hypothetical protein